MATKRKQPYAPRPGAQGEKNHATKLKERDIPRIRDLIRQGFCRRCIAKMYEVSYFAIADIARGKTWRHIT